MIMVNDKRFSFPFAWVNIKLYCKFSDKKKLTESEKDDRSFKMNDSDNFKEIWKYAFLSERSW